MLLDFYLLDVSYEVVSQEPHIIIWGVTRDGKRVLLRDRGFRPYFYAILREKANAEAVARRIIGLSERSSPIIKAEPVEKKFYGKPVNALRITTVIPESVRRYREKVKEIPEVAEVVEADIRFSLRYIIDHHLKPCGWHRVEVEARGKNPAYRVEEEYEVKGEITPLDDWSTPELRIMAFDIEVYSETGSPKPDRDPVIIIGVLTSNGVFKQFLADGFNDKNAIIEFARFIQTYDPDIIVGYNSNRFDWQYLLERASTLGLRLDVGRKRDSLPSTSTYGHVSVAGRLNVDLYNFADEIPEIKIKSLDVVADYLGVMKRDSRVLIDYVDFPKYWNDPSKKGLLLKYNEDDVRSTMGLAEKFLPFAMQLSNITRLPLDQVGAASVGYRLEWFLMHEALLNNELIPNREEKEAETYKGAVVLTPLKGIHE
ncbi:MAG: 3'-5' exonuclease, partial [Thermosphaera sp.]